MTIIGDDTLHDRRAALQHLYRSEVGAVYGFLLARCGNRHMAEDLTTETFLNAADRFAQGRGDEVSGAWLMTVAKRRLIDHWRRAASQRERIERLGRELGLVRRPEPVAEAGGEADETRRRVLAALESLPERHRAALTLRYLDEHTVSEVADLLGLGYQAAESLLARARRGFVAAFEEES
jgi:RNA polymerase sigma-70 factor (ECF subfamily)